MTSFPRRYGEWVVRWRWPVLALSLLFAAGLAYLATQQRFYNPYEIWFLPDDPDLTTYRQLTRQYGEDDFVVIAFEEPAGIFTNRALTAIIELTEQLEATALVDKASSIANYQYVRAYTNQAGEDELLVDDLVRREELPLSPEELARRQRIALGEAPAIGSLLGRPATGRTPTTAAVVARVVINDDQPENAVTVVENLLAVTRRFEAKYGYTFHLAGVPVAEHAFATFGRRDMLVFTGILLGSVVVLLGVLFRRALGVLLPGAVVVLSIGPALGVMALLGIWLNALTTVLPQILITVGIAEAIHIVATFYDFRRRGLPQQAAAVATVEQNLVPCLVTSLTTAIGFAALLTASAVPMRQLGIGAAMGVAFAWIFSFTLVPAALALWPDRPWPSRPSPSEAAAPARRLDRFLDGCATVAVTRPWLTITAGLAFFAGLMLFIPWIRVETSYTNMFKPQTALRQGITFIDRNLGGPVDLEISIDSGGSDGVKDPAFLGKVEAIEAFLSAQPEVSHTFSIVDILKRMNQALHGEDASSYRLPERRDEAAQYLLMYTMSSGREDLKDRIDVDARWTRLSARARVYSSTETQAFGERTRRFIRERFPELAAHVTGKGLLYTTLEEEMARGTVTSFATAAVPIALVQALLFRSLMVGMLSMIPNLLPILAGAGLMGIFDIPLDPGSAMVASIGIGIVVDDTVHFFAKYLAARGAGLAPPLAARHTLLEVGRPVIFTTVVLAFGFSLFAFSHFNFIAYFGQLAACVIVLALAADLLLTPALLVAVDSRRAGLTRALRRARSAAPEDRRDGEETVEGAPLGESRPRLE